jgi:hypothetical protein
MSPIAKTGNFNASYDIKLNPNIYGTPKSKEKLDIPIG